MKQWSSSRTVQLLTIALSDTAFVTELARLLLSWNNNWQGATLANCSKPVEALEAYAKALELRPNYIRGLINLVGRRSVVLVVLCHSRHSPLATRRSFAVSRQSPAICRTHLNRASRTTSRSVTPY